MCVVGLWVLCVWLCCVCMCVLGGLDVFQALPMETYGWYGSQLSERDVKRVEESCCAYKWVLLHVWVMSDSWLYSTESGGWFRYDSCVRVTRLIRMRDMTDSWLGSTGGGWCEKIGVSQWERIYICTCVCFCVCVSERACACACACMSHKVSILWTHIQCPEDLFEKSPINKGGGVLIEAIRLAVREWFSGTKWYFGFHILYS